MATLGIPRNLSRQFRPVREAAGAARSLAEQVGTSWSPTGLGDTQVSEERKHATALAYRDALHQPEQPGIRKSYEAMRAHVNAQYEHMVKPKEQGGMGIKHEVTEHDPYEAPEAMAKDVAGGRMRTFSTKSTGSHEFFSDEENDRFRAVHDLIGHAAIGRGFSRHGEEAAYRSHAQTFPKEALPALASETRGQNSFLNTFGHFPSQEGKIVGLPDWVHDDTKPIPPRSPYKRPGAPLGEQFHQQTLF